MTSEQSPVDVEGPIIFENVSFREKETPLKVHIVTTGSRGNYSWGTDVYKEGAKGPILSEKRGMPTKKLMAHGASITLIERANKLYKALAKYVTPRSNNHLQVVDYSFHSGELMIERIKMLNDEVDEMHWRDRETADLLLQGAVKK